LHPTHSLKNKTFFGVEVSRSELLRSIAGGLCSIAGGLGVGVAGRNPAGVEEAGRFLPLRLLFGLLRLPTLSRDGLL